MLGCLGDSRSLGGSGAGGVSSQVKHQAEVGRAGKSRYSYMIYSPSIYRVRTSVHRYSTYLLLDAHLHGPRLDIYRWQNEEIPAQH